VASPLSPSENPSSCNKSCAEHCIYSEKYTAMLDRKKLDNKQNITVIKSKYTNRKYMIDIIK